MMDGVEPDAVAKDGDPADYGDSSPDAPPVAATPDDEGEGWWRGVPVPFGQHKGMLLGELSKVDGKKLWGWWANYSPQPWTSSDGKRHRPVSEEDLKFRAALDACGQEKGFKKKE